MKHLSITLVEKDNSECPNIGTITTFYGNYISDENEKELLEKATKAIESHFDCELEKVEIQDNLNFIDILNSTPLDATVYLKGLDYSDVAYYIEIQQTWIY